MCNLSFTESLQLNVNTAKITFISRNSPGFEDFFSGIDMYLLPSASSVEPGSSVRLVSGSRKAVIPLASARLPNTRVGIVKW